MIITARFFKQLYCKKKSSLKISILGCLVVFKGNILVFLSSSIESEIYAGKIDADKGSLEPITMDKNYRLDSYITSSITKPN